MSDTPKLGLPLLYEAQSQKSVSINEALSTLDSVVQLAVVSRLAAPPASPTNGAAYLVIATATGAWFGHENSIAVYDSTLSSYSYLVPNEGWVLWSQADAAQYTYHTGAWTQTISLNALSSVSIKTSSYTIVAADAGKMIGMDCTSAATLTIPPSSTESFPIGSCLNWGQLGAGTLTIMPGSGVSIYTRNGYVSSGQYAAGSLQKVAVDSWIPLGDLHVGAPVLGYASYGVNTVESTSHTFTGLNIGAEHSKRKVCIAVGFASSNENSGFALLSSATIRGVSAAIGGQAVGPSGWFNSGVAFITADVPTGSIADVTLTFDGSVTAACVVYRAVNISGLVSATVVSGNGETKTIAKTALDNDCFISGGVSFTDASVMSLTGAAVYADADINLGIFAYGSYFYFKTFSATGSLAGSTIASVTNSAVLELGLAQWR